MCKQCGDCTKEHDRTINDSIDDVEEVFAQIDAERELARQYGIETAFQPFGQKLPTDAVVTGGTGGTDGTV